MMYDVMEKHLIYKTCENCKHFLLFGKIFSKDLSNKILYFMKNKHCSIKWLAMKKRIECKKIDYVDC